MLVPEDMPAAAAALEELHRRAEALDKLETRADPPDKVAPAELTWEELEAGAARRTAGSRPPSGRAADRRSR